jgi:AAA domain
MSLYVSMGEGPGALASVIAGLKRGTIVAPKPTLLLRSDGVGLLYPGKVHTLAGEPESGKSWIALAESVRLVEAGDRVLYMDYEDSMLSVGERLLALGISDQAIERFVYVHPDAALDDDEIEELHTDGEFALVVIDAASEAFARYGLDPISNADATAFFVRCPRAFARHGAAVLLLDHVTKNREGRGPGPIGAQHKRAASDVVLLVRADAYPSRASAGLLKLQMDKDRPGHLRSHSHGNAIADVRIEPPDRTPNRTTSQARMVQRVVEFLAEHPGATLNAIRKGVTGNTNLVDHALNALVTEGFVRREKDGQAHRHHIVKDYPGEDALSDTALSRPDHAHTATEHGRSHRAPAPLPLKEGVGVGTEAKAPTAPLSESPTPNDQRSDEDQRRPRPVDPFAGIPPAPRATAITATA